jgi:hypothetical protein
VSWLAALDRPSGRAASKPGVVMSVRKSPIDGVADGEALTDDERGQVRVLRERLKTLIERHNARLDEPIEPRRNEASP